MASTVAVGLGTSLGIGALCWFVDPCWCTMDEVDRHRAKKAKKSRQRLRVGSKKKVAARTTLLMQSPTGLSVAFPVLLGAAASDLQFLKDFIAGGTSGIIAKVCTSGIEHRKLVAQVRGNRGTDMACRRLAVPKAVKPRAEPQSASVWPGTLVNCLRYFPTQACNFAFKDLIRSLFPKADKKTEYLKFFSVNMAAGALAGAASLLVVYPLDMVRTLLEVDE